MQPLLLTVTAVALIGLLAGCANDPLKAPCPHFGATCLKTPVNSWSYHH